jgi:hypothetical protein
VAKPKRKHRPVSVAEAEAILDRARPATSRRTASSWSAATRCAPITRS